MNIHLGLLKINYNRGSKEQERKKTIIYQQQLHFVLENITDDGLNQAWSFM